MIERFDLNNTKYKFRALLIIASYTRDDIIPEPGGPKNLMQYLNKLLQIIYKLLILNIDID